MTRNLPRTFLALFAAVLLNQKVRLLGFYRTVYFLPVVTSLVAASVSRSASGSGSTLSTGSATGRIGAGHARALLSFASEEQRMAWAVRAAAGGATVRQIEAAAAAERGDESAGPRRARPKAVDPGRIHVPLVANLQRVDLLPLGRKLDLCVNIAQAALWIRTHVQITGVQDVVGLDFGGELPIDGNDPRACGRGVLDRLSGAVLAGAERGPEGARVVRGTAHRAVNRVGSPGLTAPRLFRRSSLAEVNSRPGMWTGVSVLLEPTSTCDSGSS